MVRQQFHIQGRLVIHFAQYSICYKHEGDEILILWKFRRFLTLDSEFEIISNKAFYFSLSSKSDSSETMTSSSKESSDLRHVIQIDDSTSSISTFNCYSSQNSLIELLGQHIVNLITTPSNTHICTKIERIIQKLLSDPAPNKEWILSLIDELKNHSETVEFYKKMNSLIMSTE